MSVSTNEVVLDPSNLPLPVSGPLTDTQLRATPVPTTVSGLVSISNFPATQPVSGPLTDTQLRATPVPVSSAPITSNTAVSTQVPLTSGTNATILAANANRKKIIVFAPKATLYLKLGATASATSFAYIVVAANTTLEITTWTGQIDALSTVNQTVNVTELV